MDILFILAILIGLHDPSIKSEIATTSLGRTADHLIKHGY